MWLLFLTIAIVIATTSVMQVQAQLSKDMPLAFPNASIDVDMAIDPEEPLPINGTMTMDTTGINDYDINDMVPEGVSVVIQNDSVTVTNHEVTIEDEQSLDSATEEAEVESDDG